MAFLKSLQLSGLLSFAPGSEPIPLRPLNVLIGPNGSGKSNLIEAVELLRAAPSAFANAIRDGGGAQEWLWKGEGGNGSASIEVIMDSSKVAPELRYRLAFTASAQRTEVTDEVLENLHKVRPSERDVFFYYRFQAGRPAINVRESGKEWAPRHIERQTLVPDESVLSQRKDPDLYPELTWVGQQFGRIQAFREWTFGRYTALRKTQRADMPSDELLADASNLALVLNELEHSSAWTEFNRLMKRFLPRFERFSVKVYGGSVQFFLHEGGLRLPVPATRLSDGTIRFMSLLAVLLSPNPPPLVCIEEPELGLHPDALLLLGEVLVEASARTQLIVTTHSDTLVSALTEQVESVLICEHIGQTQVRRVESDKLQHWLDKYRLGEIWRLGKLGGNP
jgi:predicted ATPase